MEISFGDAFAKSTFDGDPILVTKDGKNKVFIGVKASDVKVSRD